MSETSTQPRPTSITAQHPGGAVSADTGSVAACCAPTVQVDCCAAEDKAGCCGTPVASGTCGCQA
jgi:hypothetical protein